MVTVRVTKWYTRWHSDHRCKRDPEHYNERYFQNYPESYSQNYPNRYFQHYTERYSRYSVCYSHYSEGVNEFQDQEDPVYLSRSPQVQQVRGR